MIEVTKFASMADRACTSQATRAGFGLSFVLPAQLPGAAVPGPFQGGVEITLPWPSHALSPNARGSWRRKAQAVKAYRKACAEAAWQQGVNPTSGLQVDMVTFCPPDARAYDDDNLIARFKAGRDGLADALGVDDKTFRPSYAMGAKTPGGAVRVTLSPIPG